MEQIKFSAFSDLHYFPNTWYPDIDKRLDAVLARAKEEKVDFIIHAGDFSHRVEVCTDVIDRYNRFEIPTYHTLGNHEFDSNSPAEVLAAYQMPSDSYWFDCGGFRIISVSTNACRIGGEDVPYDHGNYFQHPEERDYVAKKEMEVLREGLLTSPFPCVLFSHNDLGSSRTLRNWEEVQAILAEARAAGKYIPLAVSGHLHHDYLRLQDGTCYFGLNSTSFDWIPIPHDFYPAALAEKYVGLRNTLMYENPVHAVVTLREDGLIDIRGMKGGFIGGIDRYRVNQADLKQNMAACVACVRDYRLILPREQ